jgi:hypothetical protein
MARSIDVFGAGEHVTYRPGDMTQAAKDPLPGVSSGVAMASGQCWLVYGNNTLSVR